MATAAPAVALSIVFASLFSRPIIKYVKLFWESHYDCRSCMMRFANDAALFAVCVLLELLVYRRSEANPKML